MHCPCHPETEPSIKCKAHAVEPPSIQSSTLRLPRPLLVLWLSTFPSIVALSVTSTIGDLGDVSVLVSVMALILAYFFHGRNSVCSQRGSTIFLLVTVSLSLV